MINFCFPKNPGKQITFHHWGNYSDYDVVSGNPFRITRFWSYWIKWQHGKKKDWNDWFVVVVWKLWRGFQKPLDFSMLASPFTVRLNPAGISSGWILGLAGASQIISLNYDGVSRNPLKIWHQNLARANPSLVKIPFHKELFMASTDISWKLTCQPGAKPYPQANRIMKGKVPSFVQLRIFLGRVG